MPKGRREGRMFYGEEEEECIKREETKKERINWFARGRIRHP